jgi:Zn-dependent protease with chaperone function
MAGIVAIAALATVLAVVPPLVDRWALRRGASPRALAALALVTLLGVVATPLAFAICTGSLAIGGGDHNRLSVAALGALLLVAFAAGRTLARIVRIRRRWATLARVTATLGLHEEPGGVKVLPVEEALAFVSGSEAFISRGLTERLTPAQRRAVIEHEREHAQRRHARLLAAARAISHGAFDLRPARHAAAVLERELDALADRAAAHSLGDPVPVREALRAVATATCGERELDPGTRARIERLLAPRPARRSLVDAAVGAATLTLGALLLASLCLAIHAGSAWLGIVACLVLVGGFASLSGPALKPTKHPRKAVNRSDAGRTE